MFLKDLLKSIQSLFWLISFSSKVPFLDVEFFVPEKKPFFKVFKQLLRCSRAADVKHFGPLHVA